MKIISFAWTTPAVIARQKTCTRRDWNADYASRFKADEVVSGWDRGPRMRGHEICQIRLTQKPYQERSCDAPDSDWQAEGFEYLTKIGAKVKGVAPFEVWRHWKSSEQLLWVVRFEIIEVKPQYAHTANQNAPLRCQLCFAEYLGDIRQ